MLPALALRIPRAAAQAAILAYAHRVLAGGRIGYRSHPLL